MSGHRTVPHTADVRIEAWAPSREECVTEAVRAMVGGVAQVRPDIQAETQFEAGPGSDEDLLVSVLDEVIFLMDTTGRLPAVVDVEAVDGGLRVRLGMAEPMTVIGAAPKAVSLNDLTFGRTGDAWACAVTVDV